MSGGTYEYVMGYSTSASVVGGSSKITEVYTDFFTNSDFEKYYDEYSNTINLNYNNRILGDATGEMGPFISQTDPDKAIRNVGSWYKDYALFPYPQYPWFYRSGAFYNGNSSGVFCFYASSGHVSAGVSFRVVLAPTK